MDDNLNRAEKMVGGEGERNGIGSPRTNVEQQHLNESLYVYETDQQQPFPDHLRKRLTLRAKEFRGNAKENFQIETCHIGTQSF